MKKPSPAQLSLFRKYLEEFITFSSDEWDVFQDLLSLKVLEKKSFFVEAGQVCSEVGFIIQGSVRYVHRKDGEEITAYFSLDEEMVSAYKSFLTQQPALVSIEAIETTTMIIITHHDLHLLFDDPRVNFKIERFGRLIAESLICCYEDRVFSFVVRTPEERYLDLMKNHKKVFQRVPQHYIANYLGITPVSLSRIRKRILASLSIHQI